METTPNQTDTAPSLTSTAPKRRSRGALDKEILAQLQQAQEIAEAAKLPAHVAPLEESEILPADPDALLAKITSCRNLLTEAVDERSRKKSQTVAESQEETELVRLLRRVQTAAQQKYADSPATDDWKGSYFIGHNITLSRASLATYSVGILNKLESDTLPGVTPAFRAKLTEAHGRWVAINGQQAGAKEGAVASRQAALALLEEILQERRRIQHAADFQFPVGEPEHLAARTAFRLEPNRSFRG